MYRTGTDKSTDFRIYKNAEAASQATAEYLFNRISACILEKGVCHVILPGGTTPARCMEILAEKPLSWDRIHWYPSDERCYEKGHEERNDLLIYRSLFTRPDSVVENFHPIPAELGADEAAAQYAEFIDNTGPIDLALLGIGEDGHTASLFPDNPSLDDIASVVAIHNAPKAPSDRVSFGLHALRYAGETVLLATGSKKSEAVAKLQFGELIPATMIEPDVCFVDEAAMSRTDLYHAEESDT